MVLILAVMKSNYSAKKGYLYLTLESRPSFDITKQFKTIGNNLVKGANSKVFALDVEGLPVRFHQLLQLLHIGPLQLSHLRKQNSVSPSSLANKNTTKKITRGST